MECPNHCQGFLIYFACHNFRRLRIGGRPASFMYQNQFDFELLGSIGRAIQVLDVDLSSMLCSRNGLWRRYSKRVMLKWSNVKQDP